MIAFISVLSTTVNAQFRAGVQGTVTDSTGAVVPGATVVLMNKDTNQTQQTVASDDGFYRFSSLAPGNYQLSAEKAGFKKAVIDTLKVDAEAVKGQDIVLEAGVISETVTVQADNVGLQTEDPGIRKTVTNEEILRLPQVGRDPYELARLTPGVFGAGSRGSNGASIGLPNTTGPGGSNASIFQTENQVPISANGQ
ncbi:MAG: carboxypeptidase-like regulatory domain-containing protein, partial [Acidobacteriota bacterium]